MNLITLSYKTNVQRKKFNKLLKQLRTIIKRKKISFLIYNSYSKITPMILYFNRFDVIINLLISKGTISYRNVYD